MPKNPRGAKARAVGSVKRAQKDIQKFDKQEQTQRARQGHQRGTLSSNEIRNAYHRGYVAGRAKFEKRSAKKK